ncbi:hypothetical protein [Marmoricola endophyticus]|nr:hypothetical protein [Marmoricola endophyticus]
MDTEQADERAQQSLDQWLARPGEDRAIDVLGHLMTNLRDLTR